MGGVSWKGPMETACRGWVGYHLRMVYYWTPENPSPVCKIYLFSKYQLPRSDISRGDHTPETFHDGKRAKRKFALLLNVTKVNLLVVIPQIKLFLFSGNLNEKGKQWLSASHVLFSSKVFVSDTLHTKKNVLFDVLKDQHPWFQSINNKEDFIENVIFCRWSKIKALSSFSSSQPSFEYKRNITRSNKQIHPPVKYITRQHTKRHTSQSTYSPASTFSFWESEGSTTFVCAVESLTLKCRVRKKEVRIWIEMI